MEPRPGDSGWAHAAHRRMHTSQAIRAGATGYPELRSARCRHHYPSVSKVAARASANARRLRSNSQPCASRGSQAVKGLREGPRAPTLQPGNNGLGCLHARRELFLRQTRSDARRNHAVRSANSGASSSRTFRYSSLAIHFWWRSLTSLITESPLLASGPGRFLDLPSSAPS